MGVDDDEVAAYARENDTVILTNDTHFLDRTRHPGVTVLLYTNNRTPAYKLAAMIAELTDYYPSQDSLPRETYLSEKTN